MNTTNLNRILIDIRKNRKVYTVFRSPLLKMYHTSTLTRNREYMVDSISKMFGKYPALSIYENGELVYGRVAIVSKSAAYAKKMFPGITGILNLKNNKVYETIEECSLDVGIEIDSVYRQLRKNMSDRNKPYLRVIKNVE